MEKDMQGKVALVTGAGSGIGKACAMLYAQHGASVVVSDIADEHGQQVVDEIAAAGGNATFVRADVGDPAQCEQLVAETVAAYGRLDMACNNAGIGGEQNPTADYSLDGWQHVININLNSVFYCMKYQLQQLLKQGGGGAIVNMSSILGQVAFATSPGYVAAKHALLGLTKTAAVEYAPQSIRINSVGPAFIDTPLLAQIPSDMKQMLIGLHPIGRLGRAEEVAELVIWLSSDKASFVTGAYYPVDGGYLAR
ncbi:SDR family NAD(P)-dependent oxidoreductase [Spirosoma montaniterrae]|uniref:Short-chain dehydrogenase n=1 Tax=Spirosoma montaniterrae TaxID=1178516 RepID=A0A1P9WZS9_9BACT|nr:SDR family oxidoreductase [Spirosoma montaniterrae]AQG80880.1 short-chain dehydrogenase [Spirosoma montaniterrae]